MKIGVYIENYEAGGVESVILNTIECWPRAGDEFIIIANKEADGVGEILKRSLNRGVYFVTSGIVSVPSLHKRWPSLSGVIRVLGFWGRHMLTLYNIPVLLARFRSLRLDRLMIHNGGYPGAYSSFAALAVARRLGLPKVVYIIHSQPTGVRALQLPFDWFYDRYIEKLSTVVCVSQFAARLMSSRRFLRLPVHAIHNGIVQFQPGVPQASSHACDACFNIAVVGRFDREKGHAFLLESISTVRHSTPSRRILLHVFGKGTDHQHTALQAMVVRFGLEDCVRFHGFVQNIRHALVGMDCLVLPSTSWESLPMVVLEAMSIRLPVIAADVGGVTEIITNGVDGMVVPPSDASALTNAITVLMNEQSLRISMGERGFNRYESEFTAPVMAYRYCSLLQEGERSGR
jgi:glycosyltransferase involved in cell wall biosynthesis